MSNKKGKKKKNSKASRQAAASYKSKSVSAVQKPQQKKSEPPKTEIKKTVVTEKPVKQNQQVTQKAKADSVKKADKSKLKQKPKFKSDKVQRKKERREKIQAFGVRRILVIILCACAVIAGVSIFASWWTTRFVVPEAAIVKYAGRNIDDENTAFVTDDIGDQHKFADRMNRKGDTDKFKYYAADELYFDEADSYAYLNLVNVYDNGCVLVASIVDEGGNICYSSLGLPAGRRLPQVHISQRPYGDYNMKLVVAAYDAKTYEFMGVQYSDLFVQVGVENETTQEAPTAKE